jgi:hypothetical protein
MMHRLPAPAHTKRKVLAHVIGTKAVHILTARLPDYWEVRDYHADYGIDLAIEVFQPSSPLVNEKTYDTLGEHLFAQVKGVQVAHRREMHIPGRYNVELADFRPDTTADMRDAVACEVVGCRVDTSELLTIQKMGAAIPVVLFLVDLSTKGVFYVCLNDYIDKVILPCDPRYAQRSFRVIHIPTRNRLTNDVHSLDPLLFWAKRPKLYALFQKAFYQHQSLEREPDSNVVRVCEHFARVLMQLDAMESARGWFTLEVLRRYLEQFVKTGYADAHELVSSDKLGQVYCERDPAEYEDPGLTLTMKEWLRITDLRWLWKSLANLHAVYEETCREWYLPTWFGVNCIQ